MWKEATKDGSPPAAGLPAGEETGHVELAEGGGIDATNDGCSKEEALRGAQVGPEGSCEALQGGVSPKAMDVERGEADLEGETPAAGRFVDLREAGFPAPACDELELAKVEECMRWRVLPEVDGAEDEGVGPGGAAGVGSELRCFV